MPTGATSIVTAFGTNLAPMTEAATNAALPPTTLGGIRVHLWDRALIANDHLAPLFYVSPSQINFEVSTPGTYVYISIERAGSPYVAKGIIIPVQPLVPDLYTANSSGMAAATAVSISPDGISKTVEVSTCAGGTCRPVPIDVTGAPVYLSLYGTGFDSVAPRTDGNCTIGGTSNPPLYAGRQQVIPGLGQINLLLPKSLEGMGDAAIQCSFGSGPALRLSNQLHITIR